MGEPAAMHTHVDLLDPMTDDFVMVETEGATPQDHEMPQYASGEKYSKDAYALLHTIVHKDPKLEAK